MRSLLEQGQRVRVIDRRPGDGDVVFHLAGRPGVRGDDAETERKRLLDNVVGAERVVRGTPKDVPLVFASSSVYGGTLGRPCREDDLFAPRGGYAWSKIAAEQICRARTFIGGPVHTARLFIVVGEGQRPDMALALWAAAVTAGRPVTVYGDLYRSRDLTDVAQAVDVLIRLCRYRRRRWSTSAPEGADRWLPARRVRPKARAPARGPPHRGIAPGPLRDARRPDPPAQAHRRSPLHRPR